MSSTLPILDGEILDVNEAVTFGGTSSADHFNDGFIVFIEEISYF
jgi:hypothetical protein